MGKNRSESKLQEFLESCLRKKENNTQTEQFSTKGHIGVSTLLTYFFGFLL